MSGQTGGVKEQNAEHLTLARFAAVSVAVACQVLKALCSRRLHMSLMHTLTLALYSTRLRGQHTCVQQHLRSKQSNSEPHSYEITMPSRSAQSDVCLLQHDRRACESGYKSCSVLHVLAR